jgi:hypothetical protein
VGENPLRPFVAAINRESNALVEKRNIRFLFETPQFARWQT